MTVLTPEEMVAQLRTASNLAEAALATDLADLLNQSADLIESLTLLDVSWEGAGEVTNLEEAARMQNLRRNS